MNDLNEHEYKTAWKLIKNICSNILQALINLFKVCLVVAAFLLTMHYVYEEFTYQSLGYWTAWAIVMVLVGVPHLYKYIKERLQNR